MKITYRLAVFLSLFTLISSATALANNEAPPKTRGERLAEVFNTLLSKENYTGEKALPAEELASLRRELLVILGSMENELERAMKNQASAQQTADTYKITEKGFSIVGSGLLATGGGTIANLLHDYGSSNFGIAGAGVAGGFFGLKGIKDIVKTVRAKRALTRANEVFETTKANQEKDWNAFTQTVNRDLLLPTEKSILAGKLMAEETNLQKLDVLIDAVQTISEDRESRGSLNAGCGAAIRKKPLPVTT